MLQCPRHFTDEETEAERGKVVVRPEKLLEPQPPGADSVSLPQGNRWTEELTKETELSCRGQYGLSGAGTGLVASRVLGKKIKEKKRVNWVRNLSVLAGILPPQALQISGLDSNSGKVMSHLVLPLVPLSQPLLVSPHDLTNTITCPCFHHPPCKGLTGPQN